MKPDEQELLKALQQRAPGTYLPAVRDIVAELGTNEKRAAYILEKWSRKGWYEYGVSVRYGWLTEKGKAVCA